MGFFPPTAKPWIDFIDEAYKRRCGLLALSAVGLTGTELGNAGFLQRRVVRQKLIKLVARLAVVPKSPCRARCVDNVDFQCCDGSQQFEIRSLSCFPAIE